MSAASGCATLGIGEDDEAAASREIIIDTLRQDKAGLQVQVAELQSELATLQRTVDELEREKRAALAKAPSLRSEPEPQPVVEVAPPPTSVLADAKPDETVVEAPDADNNLPDAPVPVDESPRLVQPTFTPSEQPVFENEAQGREVKLSSVLWGVHLASYRKEEEARVGWQKLQREHPDELGLLEPRVERIDVPEKGVFIRLIGGGFSSEAKAMSLCDTLKGKGMFCSVASFEGEKLSLADAGDAS